MALMKCKECGQDIARSADVCPHCGHRLKVKQYGCLPVLALLILVGVIYMGISGQHGDGRSPSASTDDHHLDALYLCQQAIKGIARNPSSAEVPFAHDKGDGAQHIFVWKMGDGLRLMNDFGAKLDAAAVCRTDADGRVLTQLTVNGKDIR